MAILGSTGDKVLGAGIASGATSGLSVGGPVGAVVGAFVGAAAGLIGGKSAQTKADLIKAHNDARQGIGLMMGLKYRRVPTVTTPPKPGSLGYLLQSTARGLNNGTIIGQTANPPSTNSDPNYKEDSQGNAYYMGVQLVPDTSKYVLPDGSVMAHQDFPSYDLTFNTGKLLNNLGYGVTTGPVMDRANNPTLTNIPYVYTSPNGSKLTADAIHILYSQGISINDLSPAAMLAAGVSANKAPLQAGFSGGFGNINPIMIIGIILLVIIFILFKRH